MEPPIFETAHLQVRMPGPADVPAIVAYVNHEAGFLQPFEPRRPREFHSEPFWHARVEQSREEFHSDQALRLMLFLKPEATVIGTANFTAIMRGPAQSCLLGFGLSEAHQGRGLMAEALRPAIAYVFNTLNLHRIMANHMPHNRRSGQLLRKLGFTVEGYARDYLRINERWEDHVLTSLTNAQWQESDE